MTTMRWRWHRLGSYIEVLVLTSDSDHASRPDTAFRRAGVLSFPEQEWWDVLALLSPQVQVIHDDDVSTTET